MVVNTQERPRTGDFLDVTEASLCHMEIDCGLSILLHQKPSVAIQLPDTEDVVVCAYENEGSGRLSRFAVTKIDDRTFDRAYFYYYPDLQFDVLGLRGASISAKQFIVPTKEPELYTSAEIGHVNTVMMNPRAHVETLAHWVEQVAGGTDLFRVIP